MATELKASPGKTRVVGVDLFEHEDYLIGDYDDRDEAFRIADHYNTRRAGPLDDVCNVYDDQGHCIRSNKQVGQKISQ